MKAGSCAGFKPSGVREYSFTRRGLPFGGMYVVSFIWSGSKIRCLTKRSIGMPDASSTMRDSVSNAAVALYAHREPGWNSSGTLPSRGT